MASCCSLARTGKSVNPPGRLPPTTYTHLVPTAQIPQAPSPSPLCPPLRPPPPPHQEGVEGPLVVAAQVVQLEHAALHRHREHQPLLVDGGGGVARHLGGGGRSGRSGRGREGKAQRDELWCRSVRRNGGGVLGSRRQGTHRSAGGIWGRQQASYRQGGACRAAWPDEAHQAADLRRRPSRPSAGVPLSSCRYPACPALPPLPPPSHSLVGSPGKCWSAHPTAAQSCPASVGGMRVRVGASAIWTSFSLALLFQTGVSNPYAFFASS